MLTACRTDLSTRVVQTVRRPFLCFGGDFASKCQMHVLLPENHFPFGSEHVARDRIRSEAVRDLNAKIA